jgi:hypothetical protein
MARINKLRLTTQLTNIKPRDYKHLTNCVGFEVFTAVVMKSIIFWDVTPCRLLSCNGRFGATYRLRLLTCWFLLKLFLRP